MLQTIRERISGWVAGIILAMLALVFAVWGINFDFTARTVAAKVNGEDIAVGPVLRAYQDQLTRFQQSFRQDVPEPIQAEIRRSVIEQFVQRRLLEQRIEDAGYRVSEEALTRYIQSVPAFQVGGQFSRDAYQAALAGAGYSVQRFEEEQRRLLEIQQLQEGIVASSFVTDEELARRVALERERRQVEWLSFPVERYAAAVEVSDEEIAERYAATQIAAESATPIGIDRGDGPWAPLG
jgi:peptidyl-prolyl cis-trans isomerase D